MAQNNYRKRRGPRGPSKNELRSARHERVENERNRAGTLRQRFPNIGRLQLDYRVELPMGAVVDQMSKTFEPDEALKLDFPCPSTCGNGQFRLMAILENTAQLNKESHEGLEICQTPSYMDPRVVCGTKLYYRFTIEYKGETT